MGLKVLYRVVAGKHSFRDPATGVLKTLIKGTKVASATDLTEVFPNKFEKVFPDEGETVDGGNVAKAMAARRKRQEEEQVEEELNKDETDDETEAEESEDEEGTDVTDKYVNIQKAGFTVVDRNGTLSVYKGDEFIVGDLSNKVELLTWYKAWKSSKAKKKK